MERRTFLALIGAASTAALAACGSDGTSLPAADTSAGPSDPPAPPDTEATVVGDPSTTEPPSTEPPSTEPSATAEPPPESTGAPILTLTSEGGFTTREYAFQNPAVITVTDDGRVITLVDDPVTDSLVLPHEERTISAEGIAALRTMLDESGLFTDVEYARDDFIADGSTTTLVVVAADGVEYRHEAYALATGGGLPGDPASTEDDPARAELAAVVSSLVDDFESIVGADTLGPVSAWVPDAYQISALSLATMEPDPGADIVAWPVGVAIDLDAFEQQSRCEEIARAVLGDLFDDLTRPVVFEQDQEFYEVYVRPAYPGRTCDA